MNRSPEQPSIGGAETSRHTEVKGTLEFLDKYLKIQVMMGHLVEAGPGMDPVVRGVLRTRLHTLIASLGIDPDDPKSVGTLEDIRAELTQRAIRPKPVLDVPGVGFFRARINEIVSDQETDHRHADRDASSDGVDIVGVAKYGHTPWRNVQPRSERMDIADYTHAIATVMTDPVAYVVRFAGVNVDPAHTYADPLTINRNWSIENGRHRTLAARSLGPNFVHEAGMHQWIPVTLSEDFQAR